MLECKLCDYYKPIGSNSVNLGNAAMCEFSGVIFSGDVEALNMDYPCSGVPYDLYLNRKSKVVERVSAFRFRDDDWRYIYKRQHATSAQDRCLKRAI